MSARSFFDTNVLVYMADKDEPEKQQRALSLFEEHRRNGTGVVSSQVLQEYFVAATLKLDAHVARRNVELFSRFEVATAGVEDVLAAIDLHLLHQISFWDGLILQTARQRNCAVLLTEDLQDGRMLSGVQVVNPFRALTQPREG
jgi:predicted nucleic acid-binding protein